MLKPKFRLFGGPNGSGKTHLFKKFKHRGYIHTEIYVNADKIEVELKRRRRFNFNAYRVKADVNFLSFSILRSELANLKAGKSSKKTVDSDPAKRNGRLISQIILYAGS